MIIEIRTKEFNFNLLSNEHLNCFKDIFFGVLDERVKYFKRRTLNFSLKRDSFYQKVRTLLSELLKVIYTLLTAMGVQLTFPIEAHFFLK